MRKIFTSLLVFIALFIVFSPIVAHAQTTISPAPKTAYPLNTNSDVPNNFHTYTQNVFLEILSSAVCMVGGVDILSTDGRCLGVDTTTNKIGYVEAGSGGMMTMITNMMASTYALPASTSTYTHDLAANFGLTKNSYAALTDTGGGGGGKTGPSFGHGIGYEGLIPILDIWKAFRNLTYLLFVFIFVVVGLGIMFRVNIDARAVMGIQNQIPKIIIGLILITFSYAIAGFLIDIMYLSIYLIVQVFDSQGLATINDISTPFSAAGAAWGGVGNLASGPTEGVLSIFKSIFDGPFGGNVAKVVQTVMGALIAEKAGGGIGALAGGIIGFAAGGPAGFQAGSAAGSLGGKLLGTLVGAAKGPSILQFTAGIIVYLIICVAIISALIRTWFSLIKSYVFILLDVIFAPLFIMAGLLPTSPGGGFSSWLRSLLGNLAAFPVVVTIFLIGASIQNRLSDPQVANGFMPPLIGNPGDDISRNIGGLIGLGLILIMPESVNIAKAAFKSPDRKLAAAAGVAIGHGTGLISKPVKGLWHSKFGENKDGTPKPGRLAFEKFVTKGFNNIVGGGNSNLLKFKIKRSPSASASTPAPTPGSTPTVPPATPSRFRPKWWK